MVIETELLAPTFLIAVPQLGDPNFSHGVVFILEHGDEGSMGLLINRPSDLSYAEFFESQDMAFRGKTDATVHQGGPVQTDRAFLLHQSEHIGPETEVVQGNLKLSYSLESLKLMADDPPSQLRIFLGYAGWGPGQLAEEVAAGAWLVGKPNMRLLFDAPPQAIWEMALREMGIEPVQLVHSGVMH